MEEESKRNEESFMLEPNVRLKHVEDERCTEAMMTKPTYSTRNPDMSSLVS